MADKLPQTVVVLPTFVDGEIPSAAKLTVLAAQTRAANRKLERAVGDHLDQSKPYSAPLGAEGLALSPSVQYSPSDVSYWPSTLNLDIASLARLLGPASMLNPDKLFVGGTDRAVTETFSYGLTASNTWKPKWKMKTVNSITESTSGVYTNSVLGYGFLAAHGDYYIDYANNQIVSFAIIGDPDGNGSVNGGYTATVEYDIDPGDEMPRGAGIFSSYNTIPSPAQLEAGGSGLADVVGAAVGYQRFQLPLVTHGIVDSSTGLGATGLLTAAHADYGTRLEVPQVLQNHLAAGDQIPEGFMILKNYTTGHAYTEAEILYVDANHVDIGNVDLTAEIIAGDKLYLVTVGTSVSEAINHLRRAMRFPGVANWGWGPISVKDISGLIGSPGYYYPTGTTTWNNPVTQYLHRDGYNAAESSANDHNIMRGNFVLGLTPSKGDPGGLYKYPYSTNDFSVSLVWGHASLAESFYLEAAAGPEAVSGYVKHNGKRHYFQKEVIVTDEGVAHLNSAARTIWIPASAFHWTPDGTPASTTTLLNQYVPYAEVSTLGSGDWRGHIDLRQYVIQAIGMSHTTLKANSVDDHGPLITDIDFYYYSSPGNASNTAKIDMAVYHENLSVLSGFSANEAYSGHVNSWSASKTNNDISNGVKGWGTHDPGGAGEINAAHTIICEAVLKNDPGTEPSPRFYGLKVVVDERNLIKVTSG